MSDIEPEYGPSPLIEILPIIQADTAFNEFWAKMVAAGVVLTEEQLCRSMGIPASVLGLTGDGYSLREASLRVSAFMRRLGILGE